MRTISSVLFLLGCLMLAARCALVREAPREPRIPVSTGPWTVDGVAPGASEEECRRALGEPVDELISRAGTRSLRWRSRDETSVTFDAADRARDVTGKALTDVKGAVVLRAGSSLEDARDALPQAKETRHTRPKGSGVISLSRKYVGSTLEWRDDRGAYSMGFDEIGRATFVRVEAAR